MPPALAFKWAQGRQEDALESLRAAVSAAPGWDAAHLALGNALLSSRDRVPAGCAARHYRLARIAAGDGSDRVAYDFATSLAEAEVHSWEPDYVRNGEFTIDGDRRQVILAHPESRIRYDLLIGKDTVLAFDIAMDPASWVEAGDGVTFAVYIEPSAGVQGIAGDIAPAIEGTGSVLFSAYIDPKQNRADRRWHSFVLDLGAYRESKVAIIFETRSGPAGDSRYDWAGWGAPRLLWP